MRTAPGTDQVSGQGGCDCCDSPVVTINTTLAANGMTTASTAVTEMRLRKTKELGLYQEVDEIMWWDPGGFSEIRSQQC